MSSGVYAIPRVEAEGTTVVTNTTHISALRGAGRPEAIQAIEYAIDRFAMEIGMDPAEVRRLNYVTEFPHTTPTGAEYDSGDYPGALDLALRSAGYDDLRAEQKRRREDGGTKQLGIGLSSYVEITNPRGEGCRWRRSASTKATPTRSRPAPAPTGRSRCRSEARRRARRPTPSSSRPSSSSPTTWRPITRTSCCTA